MVSAAIIPFQPELPQVLPTIHGSIDFREFRDQLLRLEQLLVRSGLEDELIAADLKEWSAKGGARAGAVARQNRELHARKALRCNLARILLQEDYRAFAVRLADSCVLQYFCGLSKIDEIKVPAKSTLQRYDQWWPEATIHAAVHHLLEGGATRPALLHLPEPVDLEKVFLDSTCLAAHIHYPVDWVLLRDATRTLVKAMQLIRAHGLKHRMPAPKSFLTQINTLCMEMTQRARAQTDSRTRRKRTLRKMDRVVATVRGHARRYRKLLDEGWRQTEWTRKQTEQVLRRMDQVLDQLPQARKQARQRILDGEPVPNEEKILSLYEPDVQVIVRGKAGAEVEFGNTLLLAENEQGLILEWEFFRKSAPADSMLLPRTIGRLERAYGPRLKAVGGDRGFDSQSNQLGLDEEEIYNGVCPRDPRHLREKRKSTKFRKMQRRRAQTEGRIAILKSAFGAGEMRSKGFARRALTLTWTVLVHNLWVLARLQREYAKKARSKAA